MQRRVYIVTVCGRRRRIGIVLDFTLVEGRSGWAPLGLALRLSVAEILRLRGPACEKRTEEKSPGRFAQDDKFRRAPRTGRNACTTEEPLRKAAPTKETDKAR